MSTVPHMLLEKATETVFSANFGVKIRFRWAFCVQCFSRHKRSHFATFMANFWKWVTKNRVQFGAGRFLGQNRTVFVSIHYSQAHTLGRPPVIVRSTIELTSARPV